LSCAMMTICRRFVEQIIKKEVVFTKSYKMMNLHLE